MRNYKVIKFPMFSILCLYHSVTNKCLENPCKDVSCIAATCKYWRKLKSVESLDRFKKERINP